MTNAQDSCPITPMPSTIGPYTILQKLGSGGMGEVFLAKDPTWNRQIALKRIRPDKLHQAGIRERFLKEAHIAAKLSHPGIIPIYQIHESIDSIYYTMPLVQGETLKDIIKETIKNPTHPIGNSIPGLMRIFLSICQAVAYAHAHKVLHKDLKPENIIVGRYGEVLILDWGLATIVEEEDRTPLPEEAEDLSTHLTRPGKIAGTLLYLPPERILGKKASYTSDIYALGVILYQLLALKPPFHRKTVKEYKKHMRYELWVDPQEKSPYREIPPQLSKITKKCLAKRPEQRYHTVEDILADLKAYVEGHAEWTPFTTLDITNKQDWQFQESILLSHHTALTPTFDSMEWVNLMIAKQSFPGKIKIETHVQVKQQGKGIGFLLNLQPRETGKDLLEDSFLVWIGSKDTPGCFLAKAHGILLSQEELYITPHFTHAIRIEKTNYQVKLYLDEVLALDYLSHTPVNGPYLGVVLQDEELTVGTLLLSTSSPNIQVSCLAVPDTLLALHHFPEALTHYQQIADSFAGRKEGKEARFRAGICLLEKAKTFSPPPEDLLEAALQEFDQLRSMGGSPLEYLGKSLVYKATHDTAEEIKCLHLAMRKFGKHPLLPLIQEHILFRLHETAYKDRWATYELALLAIQTITDFEKKEEHQKLLSYIRWHSRGLFFLPDQPSLLTIHLAFWLDKPSLLLEMFTKETSEEVQTLLLYALLYLGHQDLVLDVLPKYTSFAPVLLFFVEGMSAALSLHFSSTIAPEHRKALDFLLHQFYLLEKTEQEFMLYTLENLFPLDIALESKKIEFLLYLNQIEKAQSALKAIPENLKEEPPFSFLEGCLICAREGKTKGWAYIQKKEDILPSTPSSQVEGVLGYNKEEASCWMANAFFWQKTLLLHRQILFYQSNKDIKKQEIALQELLRISRDQADHSPHT